MSDSGCKCSLSEAGFDKAQAVADEEVLSGGHISRRNFLRLTGLAGASTLWWGAVSAWGKEVAKKGAIDHYVPADKKLSRQWINALTQKGRPEIYTGKELATIGMPCGGICSGQVYITGDGRLAHWAVFNQEKNSGYGATSYRLGRVPRQPFQQGMAVRVRTQGKEYIRGLDKKGFPNIRFRGEYPFAYLDYTEADFPIGIQLKVYSPFIPLNAEDSALPATIMRYSVKNNSNSQVEVTLAGWLENAVCLYSGAEIFGHRFNRIVRQGGTTALLCRAKTVKTAAGNRPPLVFADFEGDDYGDWRVEGKAFGKSPARGTLDKQQHVSGYQGKGLVNTYLGGSDVLTGKLISPTFTIQRDFINFLIGGGGMENQTCINLVVAGKTVRSATGKNNEKLQWRHWNVAEYAGKQAHLEIIDNATGAWGHINIDQIEFSDKVRQGLSGSLEEQRDFGTMALTVLGDEGVVVAASLPSGRLPDNLFSGEGLRQSAMVEKPVGQHLKGAVGRTIKLAAGEAKEIVFVVSWHFPNRRFRGRGEIVSQYYTNRFDNALSVAQYISSNLDSLTRQTELWHDTWYDSTLPYWLLNRLHSTVSTLATETCQWWKNGRFWAYEGEGCCHGTCTHVWNYEHAMARLFPRLERSAREMQDFKEGVGFVPETGMIRFRGEGWNAWAADGQCGSILKAYREHQVSPDNAFLKRNWKHVRKALEFLIKEDRDDNGMLEGRQHNTYDIDFYGPNPMIVSLYLAALRAGEEMAKEMNDTAFARHCRKIYETGRELMKKRLFNDEYFIQIVDLHKHPDHQYGTGCLSDQLFGQGWAHQVNLGYLVEPEYVQKTLTSIWKYNWAPDVGPQNAVHKPQRWFAYPGEAGLFTCTWPKSKHMGNKSVLYRDEVWTGIEYQVAGNMVWDGMTREALAICRGVHERYHPAKHNPWNEIECGDHYARGMAGWGVFTALCGFRYHGPQGFIGFAPRIFPDDFRAAFTVARGWGTFSQKRSQDRQSCTLTLKWGELVIKQLALSLPVGKKLRHCNLLCDNRELACRTSRKDNGILINLAKEARLTAGSAVQVNLQF